MQFTINITLQLEILDRTILSACCVGSAIPKNPAVTKCVWISAIRCIRWFPGILQLRYRGVAYSDAGRRKKQLIKWLCRNGFPHCQASQCSFHKALVFRLLLNVAFHWTHQVNLRFVAGCSAPISVVVGLICKRTAPEWVQHPRGSPWPLRRESPLAQNPLDGRGLLRNCAVPWDAAIPMCSWVPQFLRTPNFQHVFGIPQFDVFGDSLEFCKSDIVVPLTRVQAEGNSR